MQKIKRMDLVNQLESVRKGLTAKEMIQQSNCFIFKDEFVYTFNDDIFAACETGLNIEGAIEADSLIKLLNRIKDDVIEIEVNNDELSISGKNFSTGIKIENDILIPIDEIEIPDEFESVPKNFSHLAKLACLTASKSLNMALLTCVHIESDKIESCDNDRITICRMDREFNHDILLPARSFSSIVKENIVGMSIDDSWTHFKTDEDVILSCRLFYNKDDDYVDLEEHIPDDEGRKITLPEEIEEIINRADIFGKDQESGDRYAHISIKKGKLKVSAQNESGWYQESSKVKSKETIAFSVNTDFLRDILKMTNQISVVDDVLMFSSDDYTHIVKLEE